MKNDKPEAVVAAELSLDELKVYSRYVLDLLAQRTQEAD